MGEIIFYIKYFWDVFGVVLYSVGWVGVRFVYIVVVRLLNVDYLVGCCWFLFSCGVVEQWF